MVLSKKMVTLITFEDLTLSYQISNFSKNA